MNEQTMIGIRKLWIQWRNADIPPEDKEDFIYYAGEGCLWFMDLEIDEDYKNLMESYDSSTGSKTE